MGHTRPYEAASAHLIQEIRKQRASQECIRAALAACRRYLTSAAIAAAAERDEDPNRFITAAITRTVADLENEFTSGPDDPITQAHDLLKRLAGSIRA